MQASDLSLLSNWQNFYMIMGTAAATLTGLMFVVTTLIAGLDAHVSTLNAAVPAFNTPTVVQFSAVLLLAGVMSAPWPALSSLSLVLGLIGLGMTVYSIIVMRRMRRVPNYQSTLEDWTWYLVLPLLAYVLLLVGALLLVRNSATAFYLVGLAMILLLLTGIRNAWDMVTFLAVERAHADSRSSRVTTGAADNIVPAPSPIKHEETDSHKEK